MRVAQTDACLETRGECISATVDTHRQVPLTLDFFRLLYFRQELHASVSCRPTYFAHLKSVENRQHF